MNPWNLKDTQLLETSMLTIFQRSGHAMQTEIKDLTSLKNFV